MVKRLTALVFMFVLAGQVYAGVCGCLDLAGEAQHSCCKREVHTTDVFKAKDCCDTVCIAGQSEKPVWDRTQPAAKIKPEFAIKSTVVPRISFIAIEEQAGFPLPLSTISYIRSPRPPKLYVRHHAFLI